jgi:hypothetical protein
MRIPTLKALAALGAGAALLSTAAAADPGTRTLPLNTVVSTTGSFSFRQVINNTQYTVKCTNFTAAGRARNSAGFKFTIGGPPVISQCRTAGTNMLVTVTASGIWSLRATNTPTSGGFVMYLHVPMTGVTAQPSWVSGCTITWSPTTMTTVNGAYDGTSAAAFSGNVPASATGCTVSPATLAGAIMSFSPAPGALPPWG